jgi:hypothetical protein
MVYTLRITGFGNFVPSPEDGNRSNFRNAVFSSYFEFRTIDKSSNPEILRDNICSDIILNIYGPKQKSPHNFHSTCSKTYLSPLGRPTFGDEICIRPKLLTVNPCYALWAKAHRNFRIFYQYDIMVYNLLEMSHTLM